MLTSTPGELLKRNSRECKMANLALLSPFSSGLLSSLSLALHFHALLCLTLQHPSRSATSIDLGTILLPEEAVSCNSWKKIEEQERILNLGARQRRRLQERKRKKKKKKKERTIQMLFNVDLLWHLLLFYHPQEIYRLTSAVVYTQENDPHETECCSSRSRFCLAWVAVVVDFPAMASSFTERDRVKDSESFGLFGVDHTL